MYFFIKCFESRSRATFVSERSASALYIFSARSTGRVFMGLVSGLSLSKVRLRALYRSAKISHLVMQYWAAPGPLMGLKPLPFPRREAIFQSERIRPEAGREEGWRLLRGFGHDKEEAEYSHVDAFQVGAAPDGDCLCWLRDHLPILNVSAPSHSKSCARPCGPNALILRHDRPHPRAPFLTSLRFGR